MDNRSSPLFCIFLISPFTPRGIKWHVNVSNLVIVIVNTLNLGRRYQFTGPEESSMWYTWGELHSSSKKGGLSASTPQVNVRSKIMMRKKEQKGERVRNLTTALISMFEKATPISQLINLSNAFWISLTSNSFTHGIANLFQTRQKLRRGDEREKGRDKEMEKHEIASTQVRS